MWVVFEKNVCTVSIKKTLSIKMLKNLIKEINFYGTKKYFKVFAKNKKFLPTRSLILEAS